MILPALGWSMDVYVSPNGLPTNAGTTINAPVDLATALYATQIPPGSTVWLLGGTYAGFFRSFLKGTPGQPITIRSYPGQRATISDDRNWANEGTLDVFGDWTIFRDLEITNTGSDRTGPPPIGLTFRPMGVFVYGANVKLINLVIHDTGHGFGLWSQALNTEAYGNIIYNCGSQNTPGISNIHGHGMYIQNDTGRKLIRDNIIFNQFGWGLHIYPNPGGIKNVTADGNVLFNNGIQTAPAHRYNQILVSGYAPYSADGITLSNNFTYSSPGQQWGNSEADANLCLACFDEISNGAITLQNNYIAGGIPSGIAKGWSAMAVTGNTFVGFAGFFALKKPAVTGAYDWSNNTYFGQNSIGNVSFLNGFSALTSTGWQGSGLDQTSKFASGRPPGIAVFVRPNAYQAGRAHVVVYNWDLKDSVAVDLSSVLSIGARYDILNVQQYYGSPVVSSTYDGKPVILPLASTVPVAAVGRSSVASTGQEFNTFVVISK